MVCSTFEYPRAIRARSIGDVADYIFFAVLALYFPTSPGHSTQKVANMIIYVATHVLVLSFAVWRSAAMPCTTWKNSLPARVDDTSAATQLAEALNCSGGSFDVEWVGLVEITQPIRVMNGTTLTVSGAPDGSSIIDGANETSHFEVSQSRVEGVILHQTIPV